MSDEQMTLRRWVNDLEDTHPEVQVGYAVARDRFAYSKDPDGGGWIFVMTAEEPAQRMWVRAVQRAKAAQIRVVSGLLTDEEKESEEARLRGETAKARRHRLDVMADLLRKAGYEVIEPD